MWKYIDYKTIKKDTYSINEYGEIWSKLTRKKLKHSKDKDGYSKVSLRCENNKSKVFKVATLVTFSFIGKPPLSMKDPTINHINSIINDNFFKNLEWMDRGRNSSIRKNKGAGELNHEAKLTKEQVMTICDLLINTNLSYTEIGSMFGIKKYTVSTIKNQKNWKFITQNYLLLSKCRKTIRDTTGRYTSFNPLIKQKTEDS